VNKQLKIVGGILNALDNEQTIDIIEIFQRKTIEEIKIYLAKFKAFFKPVYTAEEFVHVDDFKDSTADFNVQ